MWQDTAAGTHQRRQPSGGEAAGACTTKAVGAPGPGAGGTCQTCSWRRGGGTCGPHRKDWRGCREPPAPARSCPVQGHRGWDGRKPGLGGTGGRWAACPMISKTRMGRCQAPRWGKGQSPCLWTGVCRRHLGRKPRRGLKRVLSKAKPTRLRAWRTSPEAANRGPLWACFPNYFPGSLLSPPTGCSGKTNAKGRASSQQPSRHSPPETTSESQGDTVPKGPGLVEWALQPMGPWRQ